jgi:putative phosphoribosyl transferase
MLSMPTAVDRAVEVPADGLRLAGVLELPAHPRGLVLFAHGSGSSRLSPRNQRVAEHLHHAGLGTLLFDLLSTAEEAIDVHTAHYRFDIPRLAHRLIAATEWTRAERELGELPVGYFGASTGAAAALVAAAERPGLVRAVVSRGGRPDLAGDLLARVRAPTLLVVGGEDREVLALNRQAMRAMLAPVELAVVARATHLFEEPGALEQAAELAARWFLRHLGARVEATPPPP